MKKLKEALKHTAYFVLIRRDNWSLIVRNHWSGHFNDSFLLVVDKKKWQGGKTNCFRFGLCNFAFCVVVYNN